MWWNRLKLIGGRRVIVAMAVLCLPNCFLFAASPPPINDLCSVAEVVPGTAPFPRYSSVTTNISGATTNGDPVLPPLPSPCHQTVSRGIWYQFTPSAGGFYVLSVNDTATTVDDTFMAMYTSAGGGAG